MSVDSRIVTTAAPLLRDAGEVVTPSAEVAEALRLADVKARVAHLVEIAEGTADAIALLHDELSLAPHDELLLADAARALRGGGLLAISALSQVHTEATGTPATGRGYRAEDVRRAVGHHGMDLEVLCAPGAAATIAGNREGPALPDLDREPGLLDAGARILAIGRKGATASERSAAYFTTLPRKIVAAAVLCRDELGRMLVVHDSFKGHWTIPGGVVDRDEDPRSGAVREAWEEAGVHVEAGQALGLFAGTWPDRVVIVYDARPAPGEVDPRGPVNAHEIDGVEWVGVDEALQRLAPYVAFQVRACLDEPGGTHRML